MPLYEPTPTHYFDPTATTSTGTGTFANPYNSIAQVQAGFTGNMAGQVLGIKRGTVVRVPSSGFVINCYGASGNPAQILAYGDALTSPILTAANVRRDWVQESGLNSIVWSLSGISEIQGIVYARTRIEMKSSFALMREAGRGYGYYDGSSKLYFIPFDSSNPNQGQTEVTSGALSALRVNYTNVAASGFITVSNLSFGQSRSTSLIIDGPDSGTGSITSINALQVIGCSFYRCGIDGASLGANACTIYGKSDAVRISGMLFGGNVGNDIINNAVEYGATSSATVEFNNFTNVGGNSVAELWYSNSTSVVRYNKGTNTELTASRITSSYSQGGIWQTTGTDINLSTYDHAKNVNNSFYGNLIVNPRLQGIRIDGGTGHAAFGNTVLNGGNRGLNFFTLAEVTGTCSATINNNLVTMTAAGNRVGADIQQGTANNANAVSITSTITGDKNLYYTANSMNWRVNNTSQGFAVATYRTNANPFDANCLTSNPNLDSNYRPQTGSPAVNAGGTVSGWVQDLDGEAIRGTPTIGCYQQRFAMMTQQCTSDS